KSAAKDDAKAPRGANRTVKLSYKEQRELDTLPEQIAALESEQKEIAAQLEDGRVFAADPQRGAALSERHEAIELALLDALERWEALESKRRGENG
ncbi:MAG: ABC transporter ATP-binding protein, partial [Burkholderiales bacterium]|nr:ABC transporter ATP-binding protein [Burkholderiales bacterium]